MLAKPVPAIPPGHFYEPKWDGFRSIVFRDGDEVEIGSRKERPMTRYFPEVVEAVRANLPPRAVIGEIVIAGDGGLDFWALQQRLHPAASRVNMLAAKTPASFIAFDHLRAAHAALVRIQAYGVNVISDAVEAVAPDQRETVIRQVEESARVISRFVDAVGLHPRPRPVRGRRAADADERPAAGPREGGRGRERGAQEAWRANAPGRPDAARAPADIREHPPRAGGGPARGDAAGGPRRAADDARDLRSGVGLVGGGAGAPARALERRAAHDGARARKGQRRGQ